MSIINDLEKLLAENVISHETASDIKAYYKSKEINSSNRLLIIFSVLGAFLIGLGIILILAHNWDQLPRFLKLIFAFIPILVGQGLCAFALKNRPNDQSWKESSSIFLILSIGAAIALVSQIYHLPGDLQSFLLIWLILALPVVYIMDSSIASLLYIAGTYSYTMASSDYNSKMDSSLTNWLLIGGIIPFYYHIMKNRKNSNATSFHHWFIPATKIAAAFYSLTSSEYLLAPVMLTLLGVFYMIGHLKDMKSLRLFANGYLVIGAIGSIGMLLGFTFNGYWEYLADHSFSSTTFTSTSIVISSIIMGSATALLFKHIKDKTLNILTPIMPVFLIFLILMIVGSYSPVTSQLLINFLVLAIAILTIKSGVEQDHLGILNYGLVIITALLICRFFDTNLNFVVRGLLFIGVGIAFFVTNNLIIKKRKAND